MTKYAYLHHNQPKSTLEGHIWALINGFISSDLISGFYCISFQCLLECWASALGHWIVRCLRWNPTFELKIMWLAIFFDDNVFARQPSRFPSIPSGTSPFRDVLENHTYRHMKWFLPAVKPRRSISDAIHHHQQRTKLKNLHQEVWNYIKIINTTPPRWSDSSWCTTGASSRPQGCSRDPKLGR